MNSKSFLTCVLILALAVSAVQGLIAKKNLNHNPVTLDRQDDDSETGVNYQMSRYISLVKKKPLKGESGFLQDFRLFLNQNKEIYTSLVKDLKLSEENEQILKSFIKGNENFDREISKVFDQKNLLYCARSMSGKSKKIILDIIVDNLNFQKLFRIFNDRIDEKIMQGISQNPNLEESDKQCFQPLNHIWLFNLI